MILKGLFGKQYQLEEKPFGCGGEGGIYSAVGMPGCAVKVYHADHVTKELEEKLLVMYRNPPDRKIFSQIAWPVDVVYDVSGAFRGFVMLRLHITDELSAIYAYPPKKNISYRAKLVIAQNICAVISEIHRAGFVFGDFNPKNIGIDLNTCLVAFLDTDSYHIVDGTHVYRCKVCLDGYVAPELLKRCEPYGSDSYAKAPLPTFTQETDNFALAIHIFRLLMNGYTPFNGVRENESVSTASPGTGNQAIKRDNYCFKPGNKPQSVAVPPLSALPDEIGELFTRAFMYGRIAPAQRPGAAEWHKALVNYEKSLVACPKNPAHMYRKELRTCPWCEADDRFNAATAEPAPKPAPTPSLPQKTFSGAVVSIAPPAAPPVAPPAAKPAVSAGYGFVNTGTPGYGGSSGLSGGVSPSGTASPASVSRTQEAERKRRERQRRRAKRIRAAAVLAVIIAVMAAGAGIGIRNHLRSQYTQAETLFNDGSYDEAAAAFQELDGYSDAGDRAIDAMYQHARTLMAVGRYDEAVTAFEQVSAYSDAGERALDARYQKAEALLEAGERSAAAMTFGALGDYQDARARSFEIWDEIAVRETISAGNRHAVGLKSDGTVVASGRNSDGQCDVESWTDIVAVSASAFHTVGLKSDGTVVVAGKNSNGEHDAESWTDIVAVAASNSDIVGLKSDGTVVVAGYYQSKADGWTNIVAVAAGGINIAGLKADGTVVAGGYYSLKEEWADIAEISVNAYMLGLKKDGTVRVAKWGSYWSSEPETWTDIVTVSVGGDHSVGLKSDGTVEAIGYGAGKELEKWTDIVAVSAGTHFTIGLRSNGRIVIDRPKAIGMDEVWTDIKVPGGR